MTHHCTEFLNLTDLRKLLTYAFPLCVPLWLCRPQWNRYFYSVYTIWFLYIQRLQWLHATSLICASYCYEIITLTMIVSVVFTQTRKIKVSWKNKDRHSPSFWKWASNKTLQRCRPVRERAYTTSEYNLINDGKNLLSFRSLQAFGKSAMPPTGWFWVYAFDMIFFSPTVLDNFWYFTMYFCI